MVSPEVELPANAQAKVAGLMATEDTLRQVFVEVNGGGKDPEEVTSSVGQRFSHLIKGIDFPQIGSEGAAILLLLAGTVIGSYSAISTIRKGLDEKRIDLHVEYKNGFATFVLSAEKIFNLRTQAEQAIFLFRKYAADGIVQSSTPKHPNLLFYMGIKENELPKTGSKQKYSKKLLSILPFYTMSRSSPHAETRQLSYIYTSVLLFLQTIVPELLVGIKRNFEERSVSTSKYLTDMASYTCHWSRIYDRQQFKRFIIISLANLLWNLLLPYDKNNQPLTLQMKIALCSEASLFINKVLNDEDTGAVLPKLMDEDLRLFVKDVEQNIFLLISAYCIEQGSSLGLQDIAIDLAKGMQELMDMSFFEIFGNPNARDPVSEEQNLMPSHAQSLANLVNTLSLRINESSRPFVDKIFNQSDDELLSKYREYAIDGDKKDKSVLDLILLFSLANGQYKSEIIKDSKSHQCAEVQIIGASLYQFRKKYLRPMKKYTDNGKQASAKVVSHIVPMMVLAVLMYQPELFERNVEFNKVLTIATSEDSSAPRVSKIYRLDLIKFADDCDIEMSKKMEALQKHNYQIGLIRQLLIKVHKFISSCRNILLHTQFRHFLCEFLAFAEKHVTALADTIESLERLRPNDRTLRERILKVQSQLGQRLSEDFKKEITKAIEKVKDPEFYKRIAADFMEDLEQIEDFFKLTFGKLPEYSLREFYRARNEVAPADRKSSSKPKSSASGHKAKPTYAETAKYMRVVAMIDKCYNALSPYMDKGIKGQQLRILGQRFFGGEVDDDKALAQAVRKLGSIVCASRTNLFFTAKYAGTRSAQVFVDDVLHCLNKEELLCVVEWIIGEKTTRRIEHLPKEQRREAIVNRLRELQALQPNERPLYAHQLDAPLLGHANGTLPATNSLSL